MKSEGKVFLIILAFVLAFTGAILIFSRTGLVSLNHPDFKRYPVRGVDVSKNQGKIDWQHLKKQKLSFAFIKATEGSETVDKTFKANLLSAKATGMKISAYHFMSFETSGEEQAQNFIKALPDASGMLAPTIDVELYGNYKKDKPDRQKAINTLKTIVREFEDYYKCEPIIYCTQQSYNLYIKDNFGKNPLFIRNVYTYPDLSGNDRWTFWQYSDKGKLKGYSGEEKFIDLDVFKGKMKDLDKLIIK